MNTKKSKTLLGHIEHLQENGTYVFCIQDLKSEYVGSEQGLLLAISRLISKKRIVRLHHQFFALVPIEYRKVGSPPPTWFIDPLMNFLEKRYYVGILSAAAIHGAGHQHPQEFQVITDLPLRSFNVGSYRIHFFSKKNIKGMSTTKVMTETGSMLVSTPELTALDLIRYYKAAGYFNNIATVLTELSEHIDPQKLVQAAKAGFESSIIQRLGYLLDQSSETRITDPLWKWLTSHKIFDVPLRPGGSCKATRKNERWKIMINENIERD